MDLNMNPEPTRRIKPLFEVPTPSGYEAPILGAINQMVNNIQEQRDNAIMVQIREQIGVDVDKNELIRALNYDRNQFNEGYRKGYRDAQEKYEEAARWRPISEPPKEHDYYFVTCDFEVARGLDIALFYPDREGEEQWSLKYVTHWKPLPEPYESEEEE